MYNFSKQFLKIADTLGPAAEGAIFTFVSVRQGEQFMLIEGQLLLGVGQTPKDCFRSSNVLAGQYLLSDIGKSIGQLLWEVETGGLKLPDGEIIFQGHEAGGYRLGYDPCHPAGGQSRLEVLTILAVSAR